MSDPIPLPELPALLKTIGPAAAHMPVLVRPSLVKTSGMVLRVPDDFDILGHPDGAFVTFDEVTAHNVTLAVAQFLGKPWE
jgi:hypothetical protein